MTSELGIMLRNCIDQVTGINDSKSASDYYREAAHLFAHRLGVDAMRAALTACAAWHWAERNHAGKFNERMELCNYSEYLTQKALAISEGRPHDESYIGVPHLIVWPSVYLDRADSESAQEIVDRIIGQYRKAALAQAEGGEQ